jgi:hypothetical protein
VLIGASGSWFATNAGAAHLFSTEGTLLATFKKPADANGYGFGASVAAIGKDRVLIGAPYKSWDSELPGAAYLFSTNGALLTTYTNTMWWNSGDDFGSSVAAVGTDCVLIGAPYAYAGPINDAGAALLFSTNGTLITIFTNPTPTAFDRFGERVAAIGKERVLIGAPGDDLGATNSGAVYLFNTNGVLLTTFANPAPTTDDSFGWSLAVVGKDRVLIGAPGDDLGATNSGAVYLFNTNGALLTTFANPAPTTDDNFGWLVEALGTDYVLIGAPYKNAMAGGGIVYLFNTNGLLLNTFTNPIPDNDALFGCSIAAVGDYQVVIGASGADMGALDGGVAYLFDAISGEYVPGLIVDGVRSASINTRNLKDGAVTAAKLDSAIGVWTRSGQNVYRLEGNVGIGTNAPQSALHVVGTVVADSFSGNLSGNATTATIAGDFTGSLAGDVIGTQHATVVSEVGGVSADNIAAGANAANNATSTNTAGGIVKRDASGNFSAGTVTGTLSGYASGSLLMATNLSVSLTSLASASTGTWTKIGNVGSFTKQSGAAIEVTYNGRLCVGSWGSGATGADFELRVDDTVVTSGRARATIVTTDSTAWGAPGTMTGIFTGLSAGSHTISIWVYGYSGSLSSVQVNPGGFNAAQVEVKEFK